MVLHTHSATGTRTRVARVGAEYPSQLDYSGSCSAARNGPKRSTSAQSLLPGHKIEETKQCPQSTSKVQDIGLFTDMGAFGGLL